MIPVGPYRNESCRKLAEKVAKGSYDSLNINVNIDSILQHKDPETTKQVLLAVQEMRDFILYANDKDYAIVIPRKRVVSKKSMWQERLEEMQKAKERAQKDHAAN